MRLKAATILSLAVMTVSPIFAQDAADSTESPKENPELKAEIAYIEALIQHAFPDFAAPIIVAVKKKWPEAEAMTFALEVRSFLALGKYDEAQKMIAALPDRKSTKFWAARLEMANSYFTRGQIDACIKIYDEFFVAFPKPPQDIFDFYMSACYTYGMLLMRDNRFEKAAEAYEKVLPGLKGVKWLDLAVETAEIYMRLAETVSDKAKREKYLKAATKLADRLLWHRDKPVIFGRAVAMKAHTEELRGNIDKANEMIEEYLGDLQEIHNQIIEYDPDGKHGLLRMSPLPECRYLQAKMLWDEAKRLAKEPNRDDNKIKDLMFGPRKGNKRNGRRAAFNIATSIFLNYETSTWAPAAGEMAEEIREFAEKEYKAKIKTKITPEQIAKVRAQQFKAAAEFFANNEYQKAIDAYLPLLGKYPELPESLKAIENVARAYLDLYAEEKDETKKFNYRIDADAIEGYLAERFSGQNNKVMMIEAGNAVVRLASLEKERRDYARADRLYTDFLLNYRNHTMAGIIAASRAGEFTKEEKWADAKKYYDIIVQYYTNSTHYVVSLSQLSRCCGKLGDRNGEIQYLREYLKHETIKLRRLQAQFKLAQMLQNDGQAILTNAGTNSTPESVEAEEKRGTAQIIRATKEFMLFAKEASATLEDPATPKDDIDSYKKLHQAALFMIGECWSRMNRPEKNLEMYRKRAAVSYEAYLKEYPEGEYAKIGYVKLGMIYTALNDLEKSKDALDRLSTKFPDSDEAKNAKPRLAKSLIEIGMRKEGTEIYAEMLRTDGAYTARQFLNAGDALIDARSWDLANQAFEKCILLAGTNSPTTVARAHLGKARAAWKQGSLAEARESLDQFLADEKMSRMAIAADANFMLVEIASEQGRHEKDDKLRAKHFGAAIGAIKKVRQYWSKKPKWEQDVITLMSGDVLVDRMKAEESMNLDKEKILETCGLAANTFKVFLQTNGPSESYPFEKMNAGELSNLERAYASLIPLLVKLGAKQAEDVIKFGEEYLKMFPNGKNKTEISNCINQARADLPSKTDAPPAATPPAATDSIES